MRGSIDNWVVLVVCCIAVPSFVILFFQAGKASLLPPKDGVRKEGFGCCSQGLVFVREQVPDLVHYLREKRVGQYDLMTMEFARDNDFALFALYPMQIQHIGRSHLSGNGVLSDTIR